MEKQEKIEIIKRHIANVIYEEQKKYQTTPEIFILDKKEFLEDTALARLNKKYNLIRDNSILAQALKKYGYLNPSKHYIFSIAGAFTDGKNITILLNNSTFNSDFNKQLYFKILSAFHEFKHIGQMEKFDIKNSDKLITNYDDFRYLFESNCKLYIPLIYTLKHDDFYFEIEANIYGIENADEYCCNNNISIPDYHREYVQRQYSKMLTYDFDKIIKLNRLLSLKPNLTLKFLNNPTYNIFFEKVDCFKKLSDIINDSLFYSLEDKLKMEMLTSTPFLSSINYNLSDIEKNLILENIDKKISNLLSNYKKNRNFHNQQVFDYDTFIRNSTVLLSKIETLLKFKLQHAKDNNNKEASTMEFQQEIQNIRSICDLNHGNILTYNNYVTMNDQLNNIISTFNDFIVDKNNLNNAQQFLSIIKVLQEAILAKFDISSMAVDAKYKIIANEYEINKFR